MIVQNIDFSVNQQTIKFSTMAQLVANSAGIATASFSFGTDWDDYDTIKVIFSNGNTKKAVIMADGITTVTIPAECLVAGRLVISAVGLTGAEGEETFKRATTELNRGVEVIHSGATEGDPSDLPTPTEAEQILLLAASADATATQANETANTANTTANTAISTANTADAKAQTALNHTNTYKGLRLAKQIILSEAAATIEFDTDDDGNPLNSELGGELLIYCGENASVASNTGIYLQLNGITANQYWYQTLDTTYRMLLGAAGSLFTSNKTKINNLNGYTTFASLYACRYSGGGFSGIYGGGMTTPQTAVTAIKLFLASGTFPSGTVVEWWERG